jgi:hypothetical protein
MRISIARHNSVAGSAPVSTRALSPGTCPGLTLAMLDCELETVQAFVGKH